MSKRDAQIHDRLQRLKEALPVWEGLFTRTAEKPSLASDGFPDCVRSEMLQTLRAAQRYAGWGQLHVAARLVAPILLNLAYAVERHNHDPADRALFNDEIDYLTDVRKIARELDAGCNRQYSALSDFRIFELGLEPGEETPRNLKYAVRTYPAAIEILFDDGRQVYVETESGELKVSLGNMDCSAAMRLNAPVQGKVYLADTDYVEEYQAENDTDSAEPGM